MDNVIVYSAPNCYKCEQLKSKLKQKGIKFDEINVKGDEDVIFELRSNGLQGFPQVKVDGVLQKDYIKWLLSI